MRGENCRSAIKCWNFCGAFSSDLLGNPLVRMQKIRKERKVELNQDFELSFSLSALAFVAKSHKPCEPVGSTLNSPPSSNFNKIPFHSELWRCVTSFFFVFTCEPKKPIKLQKIWVRINKWEDRTLVMWSTYSLARRQRRNNFKAKIFNF